MQCMVLSHRNSLFNMQVFINYADNMLYCNTGRHELNIVGWCKLLRDCRCVHAFAALVNKKRRPLRVLTVAW